MKQIGYYLDNVRFLTAGILLIPFIFAVFIGVPSLLEKTNAQTPTTATQLPSCWPNEIPIGALPGQALPIWCYTNYPTISDTHTEPFTNSWVDEFNHGKSLAQCCGPAYTVIDNHDLTRDPSKNYWDAGLYKAQTFAHNDHWMVDIAFSDNDGSEPPWRMGGTYLRTNKTFQFQDYGDGDGKKLIIEADIAAGVQAMSGFGWTELVFSDASMPTDMPPYVLGYDAPAPDSLYALGHFGGAFSYGCRIGPDYTVICQAWDNGRPLADSHKIFETGQSGYGLDLSYAFNYAPNNNKLPDGREVYRACRGTDPDVNCRDRFRIEILRNELKVYVNGILWNHYTNVPAMPEAFYTRNLYPYFASWTGKGPYNSTLRFHWDRIAVNPKDSSGKLLAPSAAPSFGTVDQSHNHGTTPTVSPTQKPTATPTPSTQSGTSGLKAEYFDNKDLTNLKLTRTDSQVNFNWWWGSPASGIGNDTFSVRWTGFITVPKTELYTFHFSSDDGARLWIDNKQIMNRWFDHAPREYRGSIQLEAGKKYPIKLEYYENRGRAQAELRWSSTSIAKQLIPTSVLSTQ